MSDLARLTAALAERYRIERELGTGGMATVYLAPSNIPVRWSTKAARLVADSADDPLEPDEGGRAVAAVHHQVFHVPLAPDIAGEVLDDGGAVILPSTQDRPRNCYIGEFSNICGFEG